MTREELGRSIAKGFRGIVEKLEQLEETIDRKLDQVDSRFKQYGDGVVLYQKDTEERFERTRLQLQDIRQDVEKLKKAADL